MAFILATNRKKETHFDYNAEYDTTEQWFSNFLLLRTAFTAPKTAAGPFVLSVFSIMGKLDLAVSKHEHLNRPGKKQISGFGLPPLDVTKIKYKKVSQLAI